MKINLQSLVIVIIAITVILYGIIGGFYYTTHIEGQATIVKKYTTSPNYRNFDRDHYFKAELVIDNVVYSKRVYVTEGYYNSAKLGDRIFIKGSRLYLKEDVSMFWFVVYFMDVLAIAFALILVIFKGFPILWKALDKTITLGKSKEAIK